MKYRNIWNEKYTEYQNKETSPPGLEEIQRYRQVYSYYLRQWFPEKKDAPVLEVACGSGLFLNLLRENGYSQAFGLDSSPQQIALAQQQGFNVEQANALEFLKNESKHFQTIVALDFIEHLYKDEALDFLHSSFNRLEPGGRIILQTPNGESPWVGSVFHGDLTHEVCYTPHLLEKLLRQAGFESIKFRPCGPPPIDFISTSRKFIWDGMTMVCRLLNIIEGAVSSGIYTRVFMISGIKPG
ncbi:MAG: class I SAM-dependent methyltransferase [Candidatus Nitronauta litoralis]|uniref:Class I SAM-dependent methyltransferase n=1 Tax=Candidatus Nitronauta litoralis TaxID=2705533 RepID=A0A7T0G1U6_9BACT|nr:MAG: class I SAM-dependent methyltransferase [Candidatus Nitronauta litoralis]